jgi:hypothetical protein
MKGQIIMSQKEVERISILDKAVNNLIKTTEGAKIIGVSDRHFRRLKNLFRISGVNMIAHKSRGKRSHNAISQQLKKVAMNIVREKYHDFGPTLAQEKLLENHEIKMSVETVRQEMIKEGIWTAKVKKRANIHQMRERRTQEGELVQIDGSPHRWFEHRASECDLLVFIDDATGKLLWLEFAESESTESYFKAVKNYLLLHGRPLSFYSDKHSVFRVNTTKVNSASINDDNGETQFGRAMKELEIEMIFANSPQAKGRVERSNQTLQDRLVKELRLLRISSIEEGNKYLPEFMMIFNRKFSVEPKDVTNAHRQLLESQKLDEILCIKNTRVLSKNLTAQYKQNTYQIDLDPRLEYTLRKAKIEVIEGLDGEIQLKYKNKNLRYSVIQTRPFSRMYDSKQVNKRVDEIKAEQSKISNLNFVKRTF